MGNLVWIAVAGGVGFYVGSQIKNKQLQEANKKLEEARAAAQSSGDDSGYQDVINFIETSANNLL